MCAFVRVYVCACVCACVFMYLYKIAYVTYIWNKYLCIDICAKMYFSVFMCVCVCMYVCVSVWFVSRMIDIPNGNDLEDEVNFLLDRWQAESSR